jgi:hypothetical protein
LKEQAAEMLKVKEELGNGNGDWRRLNRDGHEKLFAPLCGPS